MADTEYPSNVSELRYPGGGELARIKMQPHSVEAEQSVLAACCYLQTAGMRLPNW